MHDREPNRRTNDTLQGGEDNPAYGEDSRDFGEGGQTVHRPLSGNDVPKRKAGRDPTVPREDTASTSERN
jgi:hypothetical protein